MGRFTKRPVTIDAILASEVMDGASAGRFSRKPENINPIPDWIRDAFEQGVLGFESSNGIEVVLINTKEGQMRGERTDWIIRGVKGELYPCKPDIFEATYDAGEGRAREEVLTVNFPGDVTAEQFEKFRKEWEASHNSISKSMLTDVESVRDPIVQKLNDQLDAAWGLIANAGGGDWKTQRPEWIGAAERWRDNYATPTMNEPPKMATDFAITNVAVTENGFEVGGTTPIVDQPPPTEQGDKRAVWEMVIEDYKQRYAHGLDIENHEARYVVNDMLERDAIGRERYGTPLTAFNGRDALVDAYQEQLDAAVYLRQAIEEGLPVRASYDETLGNITRLRALINERTTNAKK